MKKPDMKNIADNKKKKKSISMHADIPVWHDCCSCEAEPYWVEAFENGQNQDPDIIKKEKA